MTTRKPATVKNIKAKELSSRLQERFSVTPQQLLTITVAVEETDKEVNIGSDLLEGMTEIVDANKKGVLPEARGLLKEL